ncbi:MAG: nucleotidyltransferase domain-containing protein [Betaproteobacteria bacterium]|nr:nucleotidyltransferase domain-containing protein [Betaproteobacteria bacterium]
MEARLREVLLLVEPPIHAAWLFGSMAKGTDQSGSDIDVMIVRDDLTMAQLLERLHPLEMSLGRKINPTLYSIAEFERRNADPASFVNKVLSGPVIPIIQPEEQRDA